MKLVRNALTCVVMLLAMIVTAQPKTKDCTVSNEFQLNRTQALAGVLQDPYGATLSGMELELRSGTSVVRQLRTDNQGAYNFGQVPAGKYRIHIQYGGDPFCAPKVQCGNQGCSLQQKLTINPKNAVLVH